MSHGTVACLVLSVAAGRVTVKHHSPDLAAFHGRIKAGTALMMAKSVHMGLPALSIQETEINMLKGRQQSSSEPVHRVQIKVLAGVLHASEVILFVADYRKQAWDKRKPVEIRGIHVKSF